MEQATTYEDAKRILIEAKLVAPVYFILGGTNSTQVFLIVYRFYVKGFFAHRKTYVLGV